MREFAGFLAYAFGFLGSLAALLLAGIKFTKSQRQKYPMLKWLDGKQILLLICTLLFGIIAYTANALKDDLETEEILNQIAAKNYPVAIFLNQKYNGDNIKQWSHFDQQIKSGRQKSEEEQWQESGLNGIYAFHEGTLLTADQVYSFLFSISGYGNKQHLGDNRTGIKKLEFQGRKVSVVSVLQTRNQSSYTDYTIEKDVLFITDIINPEAQGSVPFKIIDSNTISSKHPFYAGVYKKMK